MKNNRCARIFLVSLLATFSLCAVVACSPAASSSTSTSEPPAQTDTGTLEISVKSDDATLANAELSYAITDTTTTTHLLTLVVNAEAQRVELTPGTWVVRLLSAELPEGTAQPDKSVSVRIEKDTTTTLTITLGADGEVVEESSDNKEDEPDSSSQNNQTDPTYTPPVSGNSGSGSSGNSGSSSSGNSGNSGGSSGSSSGNTGGSNTPVHEHSWAWVPNVVTIIDREAYDEPVYRGARWCSVCDKEVPNSHTEDMGLQGNYGHSLFTKKVVDYYIHHDAETHTEDHGYYQCSGCGATK